MPEGSMIITPVDFQQDGKQSGDLRLPISLETNGAGYIPIPITCVKNGVGPTTVLIAGNHGNEYAGVVALLNFIREIQPNQIRGRLIILPALNAPAVKAGLRASPLDNGNLNRSFPGTAHGTPTQMIAHYVSCVLLPMADLVIDLHSGGRSTDFIPCALSRSDDDSEVQARYLELMRVFGAPFGYVSSGKGAGGGLTLGGECTRRRILNLTTELGGGEDVRQPMVELAEKGVRRVLKHIGNMPDLEIEAPGPVRLVELKSPEHRIFADRPGLFEPVARVGQDVRAGDLAGRLHFPDFPAHDPVELRFHIGGLVGSQLITASVERGTCLYQVLSDI